MGQRIELRIGGMTCAACAVRVERRLNRVDGVVATVNYATEKAKVSYPPTVTPDDLVATVTATGYTAALPEPPTPQQDSDTVPHSAELASLRRRLITVAALAIPGRFELVHPTPPVIVDGSHNPQAAGVLAEAIREAFPDRSRARAASAN